MELQKESIQNKISLLEIHMASGKKVENFDKIILFDLICLMIQATSSYFDIFKSYLKQTLDLDKLGIKMTNPTYDQMVNHLGDYKNNEMPVFHKAGLRAFFNVDLRNALASDTSWLDSNTEFTYEEEEEEETEISPSIGELYNKLASINSVVARFTENHMKNLDGENYENLKRVNPHPPPPQKKD